ncbi:serine/threonine-protein kinase [Fimbriiglobus ruber]|uniref:Serine/threonine protein kinase PrkC, regulator of stationary phase n=1 Tax=Fimbriiglobus ruber TaxID=1908690 RepID=A0A225DZJ3_9BACT|nr:serine/threonine-protein kinase [Fimbriiglobus ruber]OWK44994.1 Serine/threonine protein kinase PrkC, regulator of stationary phase [Fimbriiglobus ruber]
MADQRPADQWECPSRDELAGFLRDRLPPEAVRDIESHLSSCSFCESAVQELRADGRGTEVPGRRSDFESLVTVVEPHPPLVPRPLPPRVPLNRLVGQYRLVEQIGLGGMGMVYRAEHLRLKKMVAVKILAADRLIDPGAVGRFEREMAVVGRLDHPNIVRATDAGDANGVYFLAMELVDGLNLGAVNRRCRPLAVADACEVARRAALGLQHAHEHGLVHRDVKPQNLMLSRKGEVKVLDLGLALLRAGARDEDDLTATGQMMGTASYMAPEQFDACHAVDIRADLYSLGCTLYALLAGQPPFGSADHLSIYNKMAAHKTKPVPRVAAVRPDVPPGLVAVLDALLAKDPAARPATPAEVATALEPFAGGADLSALILAALARGAARETAEHATVTTADPPPASPPAPRRWRRGRLTAVVAAGIVAATVGGTLWFSRRADADPAPAVPAGPPDPPVQLAAAPPVPAPRTFVPGQWTDVLDVRPTEFHWWSNGGMSAWNYDPASRVVRMQSFNTQLLSLGRAGAGGFKLQVGVQQTDWSGDFGVFLGGKRGPEENDVQYQFLRLSARGKVSARQTYLLQRGRGQVTRRPEFVPLVITQDLVATLVDPPTRFEQRLEIEVSPLELRSVFWNASQCPLLLTVNRQFNRPDYEGEFGLYFERTSVTVLNAKFMPTE